ncbi:type IV fimbrial biogenesis protein FimT [Pseudomonas sp. ok272]|uniref:GspH/FimT family pseudopilin n=1 Tax=unclassified Pseudomonas TaxID=196821 RepID=UPI0008BAAD8B|nr:MULTISPECIES: GspH/FimT family protein [unclassified Pseudomonas]SEM92798.1 type IV fimbrial biogenesis protein FimT [Pseudomonas sp. ok272]SFM95463.1 type IV fimbrial biogenesis protein FimT [Pseudomonas sp. ok602]
MLEKGFSLIELLVALAIAAIAVQLASPTLSRYRDSLRHAHAAQSLAGALRYARTEALLRNQRLVIHGLNGDWSQGWRITLDLNGRGHEDTDNPLLLEHQAASGVSIVGNQSVRDFVRFSSLGEPLLPNGGFQAGTLHICARREAVSQHQVVLSRTGRVSVRHDKAKQALCAGSDASDGANA